MVKVYKKIAVVIFLLSVLVNFTIPNLDMNKGERYCDLSHSASLTFECGDKVSEYFINNLYISVLFILAFSVLTFWMSLEAFFMLLSSAFFTISIGFGFFVVVRKLIKIFKEKSGG